MIFFSNKFLKDRNSGVICSPKCLQKAHTLMPLPELLALIMPNVYVWKFAYVSGVCINTWGNNCIIFNCLWLLWDNLGSIEQKICTSELNNLYSPEQTYMFVSFCGNFGLLVNFGLFFQPLLQTLVLIWGFIL